MKKLLASAALALPLFASGYASAGEIAPLTDGQMDGVTAGASALATALAAGSGSLVITGASTFAEVQVLETFASEATTINLMGSVSSAAAEAFAQ